MRIRNENHKILIFFPFSILDSRVLEREHMKNGQVQPGFEHRPGFGYQFQKKNVFINNVFQNNVFINICIMTFCFLTIINNNIADYY